MTLAKTPVVVVPLEERDIPNCVEIMRVSLPWTRYPLSPRRPFALNGNPPGHPARR